MAEGNEPWSLPVRIVRLGGLDKQLAAGSVATKSLRHHLQQTAFPSDPPQFSTVPFSLYDEAKVCAWLESAGFEDIESHSVTSIGISPSAAEAAIGLVEGNPVYTAIMDRRPEALTDIRAAAITSLAAQLGDHPLRCHLRALVFSTRRP